MATHRVVILSPKGQSFCPALGALPAQTDCLYVRSGYEAAAELLCLAELPVIALVIDFDSLSENHLPLLKIARRQRVEIIGVGQFPQGLSSEHLSGMRLLGETDLLDTVAELSQQAASIIDRQGDLPASGPGEDALPSSGVSLTPRGDAQFQSDNQPASSEGKVL